MSMGQGTLGKVKEYDICFSCGYSCGITQALRAANLQFASLPFDWMSTPSLVKAARMVATGFAHWMDREDLELVDVRHSGINKRIYANKRTGFVFVHDFSLFQTVDEAYASESKKYARRAQRLDELLRNAKKVLAVAVEWPILPRLTDATLAESKRIFEMKYPGASFDILYFYPEDGRTSAHVVSEKDGITVVACEYRKWFDGELNHEIDNSQIVAFLKENVSAKDPRSEAEKAKYAADWKKQDAARWKGRNFFETFVNRTAFRRYRRLEKFLRKKGLVPPERPMWFITADEPR